MPDVQFTVDGTEGEEAVKKLLAMTEAAEDKMNETEEKGKKLETSFARLDDLSEKSLRTGLSVARRGVQLMSLFTSGTKNAVVKSMVILSQAALIAAETALEIATASSFTVIGAVNAALGFAAFASLVMQSYRVAAFGVRAGREFDDLDRSIQAGNIVFAGW